MKFPNGFGSVYKLKGKRRNPWVARKTTGYKDNFETKKSYPIYQYIGYYPSRADAITALVAFNKSPYDIDLVGITFSELYHRWSEKKYKEIAESNVKGYQSAYYLCEPLYEMEMVDIKLDHLQMIVDTSEKNTPTLKKLKTLWSQMYDYAVMREIIPKEKNLVEYVNVQKAGNPNAIKRTIFSQKEIEKLWNLYNNSHHEYASLVLILIYTGLRIGELLELKKDNVFIEDSFFNVTHSKTQAGIRSVPIADKLKDIFHHWYDKNQSPYLISTPSGQKLNYQNFSDNYWKPIMADINAEHRPHDTRHTCVSLLTSANVNDKVIKKIVGHKGSGVTEMVYTHFEIQELIDSINKI